MGGIRDCIQKHPQAFRKCFIAGELEPLTAGSQSLLVFVIEIVIIYFVIDTVRDEGVFRKRMQ